MELSAVIPCLDEAATVGECVKKAVDALERHGIRGEVIVADNGSTDGSQQLAKDFGARVVPVERRGYSSALQRGIAASRGQFVLMGDADGVAADPGRNGLFIGHALLRNDEELGKFLTPR